MSHPYGLEYSCEDCGEEFNETNSMPHKCIHVTGDK